MCRRPRTGNSHIKTVFLQKKQSKPFFSFNSGFTHDSLASERHYTLSPKKSSRQRTNTTKVGVCVARAVRGACASITFGHLWGINVKYLKGDR